MARFARLDVLNVIVSSGLVPVFYHADIEVAKNVVKACAAGGSRIVEFTNRGDLAPEVFKEVSKFCSKEVPEVILGVGSVIDEPTAAMYIAYGANFVVGPILNESIARLCNRRKVAYMPGCGSASEISYAEELGVEIVKIFPGSSVGGPDFVKSILGPCPWTRIMPTGGVDVTQESINAWFKAGVAAVGVGSNLIRKELLAGGKWEEISRGVRQVLDWIKEERGLPLFLGVEHVGFCATEQANAPAIGEWYQKRFGLGLQEGKSSIFAGKKESGRIEIMKEASLDRYHLAVRVSNFEKAMAALQAQGVELEEAKIKPDVKSVYLKEKDPVGNRIHLLWIE